MARQENNCKPGSDGEEGAEYTARFLCYHCKKEIRTFHYLKVHTNMFHSGDIRICVRIKKKNSERIPCNECEDILENQNAYHEHMAAFHKGAKKFKFCFFCVYRNLDRTNLKRHNVSRHTNERPYKCPYCEFRTSHPSSLKGHRKNKHNGM